MWSKENVPYISGLFGVVLAFSPVDFLGRGQKKIFCGVLILAALGTSILYNRYLIGHFMGNAEVKNNVLLLFPGMGETMAEFQKNVLLHPFQFIWKFGQNILTWRSITYLAAVLAPWFVWGARRHFWFWAIPAFFTALLNVLAVSRNQNSGSYHYELVMVPFFMWSVALSIRRDARIFDFSELKTKWMFALIVAASFADRGPLFEATDRLLKRGDYIADAWSMQSWNFPTGEPIAATGHTLTHFNRFEKIRSLNIPNGSLDFTDFYFLQDVADLNPPLALTEHTRDIHDARFFVLNLNEVGEKKLADLLERSPGVERDVRSGHFVTYVLPKPFGSWACEKLKRESCGE